MKTKIPLSVRLKAFLETLRNDPKRIFTGKPKTFKSLRDHED